MLSLPSFAPVAETRSFTKLSMDVTLLTDEFLQWLAAEAVKDAQTGNGIKLDYTPESIKTVDKILGKLHQQYVQAPSSISVRGLSAAFL